VRVVVASVVLLAINLRPLFASLPPLLAEVRAEFGLSAATAGLLTTGPFLCLGALGPLAPRLTRRFSIERILVVCTLLAAAGMGARALGGVAALFGATLLAGAAVAIAQVALPILIRARHAEHLGLFTGLFSMALTLGATVSSGLAVPLERLLGGWRGSLAFWALPAALATTLWLPSLAGRGTRVEGPRPRPIVRTRLAWSVAMFFALQSMGFYAGLAWLPTILRSEGWSATSAGTMQAVANLVSFAPALLLPYFAVRMRTQTPLLVAVVSLMVLAALGMLLAIELAPLWMIAIGIAGGGSLGLGLILPVLRGGDVRTVAALTSMTLSVGYLVAALGPWLLGLARDLSGGWTVPLVLFLVISALELPVGIPATRNRTLGP